MKRILDIGCGNRKKTGAIGMDINPRTNADIIHDLNCFPYPFKDSDFDEVYADNVFEHLNDVIRVIEELYRITKNNGLVKIDVPYFRAKWAYIDPTHKRFFTIDSFSYFDPEHIHHKLYPYSLATLKTEKTVFNEKIHSIGLTGLIKNIIKFIANSKPIIYENYLGHLFPMDELSFYLRVIK